MWGGGEMRCGKDSVEDGVDELGAGGDGIDSSSSMHSSSSYILFVPDAVT